jgi:endonuclease/exonuclease/phosphatase (EEP) superfamily protein YafD
LSRLVDRPPFTAVGLVWPFGIPASPDGHAAGTRFRLVAANALKVNRRPVAWAAAALDLDPDILCVAELTPSIAGALAADGRRPPHFCVEVHRDSGGTGLYSRLPLEGSRIVDAGGYALPVAFVPDLGVTVGAVHAVAPSNRSKGPRWRASFDAVAELAASVPGPLVFAGDWNATAAHGPLRELLAPGGRLRDAHTAAGRRFARTWPSRTPIALLDRVLLSSDVAVESITEHRLPGSDHRAVLAELAVTSPTFDRSGRGGRTSAT